ncbi:MAG: hypothetical protein OEM51_05985 [Gammaproteobacteria bacterium]|nr:hypothetical protein [Gammaproteobacteria bacterium]MDH3428806.1 hypothetical protein [Gammaproteobacteria bacterium]
MPLNAIFQEVGTTIYDAFVWPGNFLLSELVGLAPHLAADLGLVDPQRSAVLLAFVSLAAWTLLILVVLKIVKLLQGFVRIVNSTLRIIVFRISLVLANAKTRLVCKLRQLIPRRSQDAAALLEVELDDRDMAVLRSAAARGPGFTTSAPELAEQLPLRPAQIQRSLDRLRGNKMLEYVIGSTDGFDNYRVSQMGTAFVLNWERQARKP